MVSFDDFLFEGLTAVNSPKTVTDVSLVRLISRFSRIATKISSLGFLLSPQSLHLCVLPPSWHLVTLPTREGKEMEKEVEMEGKEKEL